MKTIKIFFLLQVFALQILIAQSASIVEGSFVSYKVKAKTLGIFSDEINGYNYKLSGDINLKENKITLTIPVKYFESGNTSRDESVAEILKYKEYPNIYFNSEDLSKLDFEKFKAEKKGKFTISGILTVAGKKKKYDFPINYKLNDDGSFTFETMIESKFSDFGLETPRFGGFVKIAPDQVFLSGKLILKINK